MRNKSIEEAVQLVEQIKETRGHVSFKTTKVDQNTCDLKVFAKKNGKRKQLAAIRISSSVKQEDGSYEPSTVFIRMLGDFASYSDSEDDLYEIKMNRTSTGEVTSVNMDYCEGRDLMGYRSYASDFVEDLDYPLPAGAGSESLEITTFDLEGEDKRLASSIKIGLFPESIRRIANKSKTY